MKWLPRTLFGQILTALLAGLLAAQALGFWLVYDERSRFAGRLLGSYAAQRIAGIVSLLDAADAEERERLVRALSVPPTRVSLDEPWRDATAAVAPEAAAFARYLSQALAAPHPVQVLSLVPARPNRVRDERAERMHPPGSRMQDAESVRPGREPELIKTVRNEGYVLASAVVVE